MEIIIVSLLGPASADYTNNETVLRFSSFISLVYSDVKKDDLEPGPN